MTTLEMTAVEPKISLHQAARDGNVQVVLDWMKADTTEVNAMDGDGYTAFHCATRYYHAEIMQILFDNGADPKLCTEDFFNYHPLHLAALCRPELVGSQYQAIRAACTYLVEELDLDINTRSNWEGRCPLHIACSSNNKAAVEVFLGHENIQLDLVDDDSDSILHKICTTSSVELLTLLLEKLDSKGQLSDVLTLKNSKELTALDIAFSSGHLRMASKLLECASNDEYTEIDPELVLDYSQRKESDAVIEFLKTNNLKLISRRDDGTSILHVVSERGWLNAAKEIAVREPSLLALKDIRGRTSLHYAAAKNHWEMVELLMDMNNSLVDVSDKDGCSPLLMAARKGHTEAFASLLKKADVNMVDDKGKNAVFLAAEADHSAILAEVGKKKDPGLFKQVDEVGNTPLHAAAEHGSEKVLEVLLDQHVDVNVRNSLQWTPLHLAARNGHNGFVKMLLAYGPVDISARDFISNTALHMAAWGGHCSVAITLLSRGASIRARNRELQTPLHSAAVGGNQEVVELLISEYQAELDVKDEDQCTPLHQAAKSGWLNVVIALLHHKADLTAEQKYGMNALELAIDRGHSDVALAMVKHKKWRSVMCHTYQLHWEGQQQPQGVDTTPMRELARKMPEIALEVLKRCTSEWDFRSDPRSADYFVDFDYEFLEDLGEPAYMHTDNADGAVEKADHPHTQGRSYRPSHLFNKIVQRCTKTKMEGYYTTWGPARFSKRNHPLNIMVKYKQTELLDHPLVSTLIAYKWRKAWPLYLANVVFYLVFLGFLTAYALVLPNPQSELCQVVFNQTFPSMECLNGSTTANLCNECSSNRPFLYAAGAIVFFCVLVRVIMEFFQLLEHPRDYFFHHENWLELFLYFFTVIFMSSLGNYCVCPEPWQWQIGALAVFLAWIHLSIFVRKLPQLGLYIIMFEDIVITFIKIIIPALLLVLAFSVAFYMMFFVPNPLFAASPFATPGLTIIKAMTMAVGEMEFESIFRLLSAGVGDINDVPTPIPYTGVSILLWIFFLIMMPILLMNLLTGLAVGDVEMIQSNAEYRKIELQIELLLKIEESFQAFHTWFVPIQNCNGKIKRQIRIKPNKHSRRKRFRSLLAGVDMNLTGEDISKLLTKPIKHVEIEHVHDQTTALLAKLDKQGEEHKTGVSRMLVELKKENSNLKLAMAELRMQQNSELAELKVALTAAMAELRTQQTAEVAELSQRMDKLLELWARREGIDPAGLREEGAQLSSP